MESELTNLLQKLKVEDNELSSNDLSELVKHLDTAFENKKEIETNNLLQTVGDLARDSDNRAILITDESLFDSLSNIIKSQSSNDTLKLAARAIGNLCFENVVSRKLFRKRGGIIEAIINLLKSANGDETTLRNCAGSLANLASDNEENQKEIGSLGGIPLLIPLLNSSSEVVQQMSSKAIHNTIDSEENQILFIKEKGIEAYMPFLDQDEEQLQCDFTSILLSLAYNDALRSEVVKLVPLIVSIAKGKVGVEDSDELVQNALDVLVVLSDKDDSKEVFVKNNLVSTIFQLEKKGGNVKKSVLKIMAGLSTIESAMKDFFQYFETVLQSLTETEEVERVLSCLLILGNLLRSNEHCKKAGEFNGFVQLMMKYADHKDLRIEHLALGVLRNLCVLVENKGKVVDAGLLDLVVKHLTQAEQPNSHIQYGITQILRSLIASGGESFITVIAKQPQVLESLVRLAKGELTPETKEEEEEEGKEKKEKDRRVEYEATRILVRITDKQEFCEEVVKLGGVGPLVELVKSPYEILQAEGVKGLHNVKKAGLNVEEAKEAVAALKVTNAELEKLVKEILA